MHYYITILLALFTFYGCGSRTITINENQTGQFKQEREVIISESEPYTLIDGQKENFTPLKFRKLMKELDHTLFAELDSKLFRGRDWLEYDKDMKKTLKDFIENSRKIKTFAIVKENKEYVRLTKRLITYEYFLQDIVKNEKFNYLKPAFDKVVNACNECHDTMK